MTESRGSGPAVERRASRRPLVEAGETVEVTERGRLVALLGPPAGSRSTRDQLVAAGRLIPATGPTGRLRSPRPVPVAAGEPSNQELLDAEREERC